jgi:phosphatidylglycerophosphate synthase
MSTAPLPPYAYRCVDQSVLIAPFRKHWAALFLKSMPLRVPANYVTLLASAFMWVLFGSIFWAAPVAIEMRALLFAALLHFYLVYDHLDGMQAKRTGTSSALGEYLDHSLDVYHGAIAVLAIFSLVGLDQPILVLGMLGCSHLAFAATMVEEKERCELFFGPVGSLEGVLLFILFCLSWTLAPVRAWWLTPLIGSWPAYYLLIGAGSMGSLLAMVDCLRRIGRVPPAFVGFAVAHGLLIGGLCYAHVPLWTAIAIVMLHGGDYVGRVIGSHLLHTRHPQPDYWAPLVALALGFAGAMKDNVTLFLLVYIAVRTGWGVVRVLTPLRGAWRWINPLPAAKSKAAL